VHGIVRFTWPSVSYSLTSAINIACNDNSVANLKSASCVWVGKEKAAMLVVCSWNAGRLAPLLVCWDSATPGNFVPPIAIRVALDSPRTLWIPMDPPNVYQSSSYLVNASLLPLSFSSFLNLLAFNLFRWRVVEGSGHSPRPRCSKLLGGNARFTCSQKYPKMLWECLGHCSELLQIKWDLRIECGSASEIDQTVTTNQRWSWNG